MEQVHPTELHTIFFFNGMQPKSQGEPDQCNSVQLIALHFFFPSQLLEKKKTKTFQNFFLLIFLCLNSCSAAFKVCPPLCSCKPALSDLMLHIAPGFSNSQIWSSLTFYCGSLAPCLAHFHWKPNSLTQQIRRHALFCYCLKAQLQLVLSIKFHIHSFNPSKPVLLKCLYRVFALNHL